MYFCGKKAIKTERGLCRGHLYSDCRGGGRRLAENQPQILENILHDAVLGADVGEDGADKDVAAVLPVAEDPAAAQVLDPEAEEAVLLVRLEHCGGRVRPVVGLSRAGVDEVCPVVVFLQSGRDVVAYVIRKLPKVPILSLIPMGCPTVTDTM